MSFPHHDRAWSEVADYLERHQRPGERVLAPDRFWWRLSSPVHRWVGVNLVDARRFTWVVVHKGHMQQMPAAFLHQVAAVLRPVHANDVFVVFSSRVDLVTLDGSTNDVRAFEHILAALPDVPVVPNEHAADLIFGDLPVIQRFADLDDEQLRRAQNEFFRHGGYLYPTRRDQCYASEVARTLERMLRRWHGRVLEVGCGSRRFVPLPDAIVGVARTDFAHMGVRDAATRDIHEHRIVHATVDASRLAFPDAIFDAAVFVDSIEHVRDAAAVFHELRRVLRPGGEMVVSYANRDSLHQVMVRKLGYPEFRTNHQHIREFAASEIDGMLAEAGFETVETAGLLLYPYWGVPGLDDAVRTVTDEDPEVVEIMRVLGERAGREHAYTGVVLARRPL